MLEKLKTFPRITIKQVINYLCNVINYFTNVIKELFRKTGNNFWLIKKTASNEPYSR